MSNSNWAIGVDVGGTFTDFYLINNHTGEVHVYKRPSTPSNASEAIIKGLKEFFSSRNINLESITSLAHGTTVATNALIQEKGGAVGVITTKGFRDLLEIGRQVRPSMYDMVKDFPPPVAPREYRFELTERIGPNGEILTPIQKNEFDQIINALQEYKLQSCAVCFLFSYMEPQHEVEIGSYLREKLPDITISLSSEVQPEFREYERFSTTLLNAYLQPVLNDYLATLEGELNTLTPSAYIGINQSSGGLMPIGHARKYPIRTVLSGPAAGAMGAIHTAKLVDCSNIITLDVGGTSADVSLIRNFELGIEMDREVAGFPIRMPMIDINTVGAGGGSIAWFDRDDLLKVGPISAGANPGPACYGQGGMEFTVTDANLLLGRLSDRGLLGGEMALDTEASLKAVKPISERLDLNPEKVAQGVLSILTANMVRAIRAISIERGHDPREFVLMPFGGAGPLLANDVARELDINEFIVPRSPGILCAQGLVVADLKEDFVQSAHMPVIEDRISELQTYLDPIYDRALEWFSDQSIDESSRLIQIALDMRYTGQNFELRVPIYSDISKPAVPKADELRQLFFKAHEKSYGFYNPDDQVELINIRLSARGIRNIAESMNKPEDASLHPKPVERRYVWFDGDEPIETPIYTRDSMSEGCKLTGPAVIDQFDATTVVYPKDILEVDSALNLQIKIHQF